MVSLAPLVLVQYLEYALSAMGAEELALHSSISGKINTVSPS